MSFDARLLDRILVCTKCRSPLVRDGDALVCVLSDCRLRFAVVHEIPNMLLEDAAVLGPEDWSQVMERSGRDPASGTRVSAP